ncbi:MAG TPA: hypothetical protein VGJ95_08030 [Pseudonocardiaceae bacterium]
MCRLAGAQAEELPTALPDLLRRSALTDHPARRIPPLRAVLDILPADRSPAVRGVYLLELAQVTVRRATAGARHRERAIGHTAEAVSLLDRPEARSQWAAAQVFLGSMWRERELGDPAENVEQSLAAFRRVSWKLERLFALGGLTIDWM